MAAHERDVGGGVGYTHQMNLIHAVVGAQVLDIDIAIAVRVVERTRAGRDVS